MDQVSTGDATSNSVGARRSRMRDVARTRRKPAPAVPDHFRTPAWLERSFVLPLTKPESNDVRKPRPHHEPLPQQSQPQRDRPAQSAQSAQSAQPTQSSPEQPREAQPQAEGPEPEVEPDAGSPEMSAPHDSTAADVETPAPAFVRPPSDDIDFGTVIRRADQSRSALRVAWISTAVAGLVLIAFLLTGLLAVAVLAAVCAVVAVSATLVRMRLTRAPVPRVTKP